MKHIAIIGAGCSGLTAIKSCLEQDLVPVCFERGTDIGGLWNYCQQTRNDTGASIYRSLVINTSKEMMAFSDFPTPEEFPPFLPHQYVLEYFKMYAENFGLVKNIQFKTTVRSIKKNWDYAQTGRFVVEYQTEGDPVHIRVFDGVMICCGHHSVPYTPTFTGVENFKGIKIHSHDYKDPNSYEGKRILIVGIGNSAVDIAVDLSRVASQVFLSTRRGAWIIGRTGPWGIPADLMANNRFVFSLPLNLLSWIVEVQANLKLDHATFGLKPHHGVLAAHPTINDELPYHLMSGRIKVRPNVKAFLQDGAQFADDTYEDIDVVIFATGYDYKLEFVDKEVLRIDNNKTDLYKFMYPPNLTYPTFAVIGLLQPVGAIMPISEMQCRWFTRLMVGVSELPTKDVMLKAIAQRTSLLDKTYVKSRRHTMQTFWIDYMDDIASEIGAKPNFKKLMLEDPILGLRCFFGPCVPAQYRLHGPGQWSHARQTIMDAVSRATRGATPHRPSVSRRRSSGKWTSKNCAMFLIYGMLLFVILITWFLDSFRLLSATELPVFFQKRHMEHAICGYTNCP